MCTIRELAMILNINYSQAHRLIRDDIVKATLINNSYWDIEDSSCEWALEVNTNYYTLRDIANKAGVHISSVNIAINRLDGEVNAVPWTYGVLRYSPTDVEKIIDKIVDISSQKCSSIPVGVYNRDGELIGVYKSISSATTCLLGVGRTTIRYRLDKRTVGRKGFMILTIDKQLYENNTDIQEIILDYNPPENKSPISVKYTDSLGNTTIFSSQREASKHLGVSQSLISRIVNNDISYKDIKNTKVEGTVTTIKGGV